MSTDNRLAGLIERNALARKIYYMRKDHETSCSRRGLDTTDQVKSTAQADLAWIQSDKELWEYRGIPQRAVVDACKLIEFHLN